MKFYIHAGGEKTGTSFIQGFLYSNREKLRNYGFFVPTSMGPRNNRKLSIAAFNADRRDDFTRRSNINTNDQLVELQKEIINDLAIELTKICSDTIILSSEQIQSRLTTITEIQRLKDVLVSVGATEIFIILYLRDPAEIANSNYSTWIKSGATDKEPPGPDHNKFITLCHHHNTLDKFSSVFGDNAIIPRVYDLTAFINGSLIEDFLSIIECPFNNSFISPDPSNEALTPFGLEILRRFNEQIPVFIDDKPNKLRGNINRFINANFVNKGEDRYQMPDSLFDDYDKAFIESNELVRARWFPERESLFEKKERRHQHKIALTDDELSSVSGMLVDIWMDKQTELITQRNNPSISYLASNLFKSIIQKLLDIFNFKK
ncbi:MAG: hypothetical protein AB9Q19_03500 [Candidatus Reddybacter sp.]